MELHCQNTLIYLDEKRMTNKQPRSTNVRVFKNYPKTDVRYLLQHRKFDLDTCFLCAESLDIKGSTSEHIIPRWAQKRFDLWDQTMVLLNGTDIPYRYLTVPCCDECNRYQLQPIETLISSAVDRGAIAVRTLGTKVIYLWLSKIFFGILYKELFLNNNRESLDPQKILDPEIIKNYESLLFFLQEARGKVETVDFCPGSIFVFNTQTPNDIRVQWDFCDNIDTWVIAIRMGQVGIIAALGDGGAQNDVDSMDHLKDFFLNPIQFRELCAVVSYRATLATRVPKYVSFSEPRIDVIKTVQLPLGGYSFKPLFEEWDFDVFAKHLAFHTRKSLQEIRPHPNKIVSFIYDESGNLRFYPIE